jgi:uncharacterized protein (TIGR02270 family)
MTLPSRRTLRPSTRAREPRRPDTAPVTDDRRLVRGESRRGFAIGLYLEHLNEASFLYDQRLALLDDPDVAWPDIAEFEERLEAHLDALVLGGELALTVCMQQAPAGDFGELYAAVSVLCRQRRLDLVRLVIDRLDPTDADRLRAATDAFCHELPDAWRAEFAYMAGADDPSRRRLAVAVIGHRRLTTVDDLLRALQVTPPHELPTTIWSLGRLGDPRASWALQDIYATYPNDEIRTAVTVALLRMGQRAVLTNCLKRAHSSHSLLLAAAFSGRRADLPTLLRILRTSGARRGGIVAIGLLGDSRAVEPLMELLHSGQTAEAAAIALFLITGARLYTRSPLPEMFGDDELFEDEIADAKTLSGANSARTVVRLCREPNVWRAWWTEQACRFDPLTRYRGGRAYSPSGVLETIAGPLPRWVRDLAYDAGVRFETDMLVVEQRHALAALRQWVATTTTQSSIG